MSVAARALALLEQDYIGVAVDSEVHIGQPTALIAAPALVSQIVLDYALDCYAGLEFLVTALVVGCLGVVASVEGEAEYGVVHELQQVAAAVLALGVADPAVAGVVDVRDLVVGDVLQLAVPAVEVVVLSGLQQLLGVELLLV